MRCGNVCKIKKEEKRYSIKLRFLVSTSRWSGVLVMIMIARIVTMVMMMIARPAH